MIKYATLIDLHIVWFITIRVHKNNFSPFYSAFTEIEATQTMKTNQMAEPKQ